MLYFSAVVFFVCIFSLMYGGLSFFTKDKIYIENRIKQVEDIHKLGKEDEEDKTFLERTLVPFYHGIINFILKITPKNKINALNKRLEKAGLLKDSSVEKWLYIKNMFALTISILCGILIFFIDDNFLKAAGISFLVMLLINTCFNFYVSRRIELRKVKILKDLPYTLDLITVSVEAGLSFDGAMARVVGNITGDLCDEFSKSLKEIRMGIERKTALKNMSDRCDVRELSMLITSLVQADELGVSLGRVLRIESANLRELRKQAAREKAMKAPIKMLFPLVFFIFPSIFIIILGPAVIQIVNTFAAGN